jgi:chromatin structure-remodeling complex subunit RSC1/2
LAPGAPRESNAKREALLAEKRNQDEAQLAERAEAAKRANVENERRFVDSVKDLGVKALETLEAQLAEATRKEFEDLFAQDVEKGMAVELEGEGVNSDGNRRRIGVAGSFKT